MLNGLITTLDVHGQNWSRKMGMTIDKTIEFFNGLECHTPQAKDARDVAIDIMRRYQKIVSIVSLNDEEFKQCGLKELKEILEVIADGNDD